MKKRFAVLSICLLLLAACGRDSPDVSSDTTVATTQTTSTSIVPPRYQVAAHEVIPNGKKLAAEVAQAVTSYSSSKDPKKEVVASLSTLGAPPSLADNANLLMLPDKTSRGEIVYPQLGGFKDGKLSVMVATRQTVEDDAGESNSVVRVLDVRLQMEREAWRAASIDSVGGAEMKKPEKLTPVQKTLLENPSIELTDSARWDIYRGAVDERLVDSLNKFAERHRFSVLVFADGHPINVFDTNKVSNHTKGRAADIWKLDGVPIIDQRNDQLKNVGHGLLASGITEYGSPFDLDGGSARSFTDIVHQDHLHVAFQQ